MIALRNGTVEPNEGTEDRLRALTRQPREPQPRQTARERNRIARSGGKSIFGRSGKRFW